MKNPRESHKVASRYRCSNRLCAEEIWAIKGRHGFQETVYSAVRAELDEGLGCKPYLCDATYRWLLTSARTRATLTTYLASWSQWLRHSGAKTLHQVLETRWVDVEDWLFQLEPDLAKRTVWRLLSVVRSFLGWAEARGLLLLTPIRPRNCKRWRADEKRVTKADGSRQVLTEDEFERVQRWAMTEAQPVVGASVLLQLNEGLRSAEVKDAEGKHLVKVTEKGVTTWTLTVKGKGQKTRKLPLHPMTVGAIERYCADRRRPMERLRGALLRPPGGGQFKERTVQRWAKQAAAAVGRQLDISSHDLRASCATMLRKVGADLNEIQERLGHASPLTTVLCYLRGTPEMRHQVPGSVDEITKESQDG